MLQSLAESYCRVQTVRSALVGNISYVDSAVQEGSRTDDRRFDGVNCTQLGHQLFDCTVFVNAKIAHLRLNDVQSLLLLQTVLHLTVVGIPIRLDTQAVNSRSFSSIEHPALQKGGVCRLAHLAAQRINLPHQMALGSSSDRRIARHVADCIEGHGKDGRFCAQPCCCQRRFDAGMARTDYRDLIFPHPVLHSLFPSFLYFPTQKRANTWSMTASEARSPVSSSRSSIAASMQTLTASSVSPICSACCACSIVFAASSTQAL